MSNFDLNVESYSTEELYKVIKTNKNCDDYEISININKIISNIKDSEHEYKYVVFLKDIEKRLLDERKEKATRKLINKYKSDLEEVERKEVSINKYPKGTINPIDKKTMTQVINIDSQFRSNYETTNANNFLYSLADPINNVISIRLSCLEIPTSWYSFSSQKKNNKFIITLYNVPKTAITKELDESQEYVTNMSENEIENLDEIRNILHKITIPDGNYTGKEFEELMNNYFSNIENGLQLLEFKVDVNTQKSLLYCKTSLDSLHLFSKNFYYILDFITNQDKNNKLEENCGWRLGFRKGSYTVTKKDNKINNFVLPKLTLNCLVESEGGFGKSDENYFYLSFDDFNKNYKNSIVAEQNNSILGSTFLARVPMTNSDKNIMNDNGHDKIFKSSEYFGPVKIEKFRIQLLDKYGKKLNLNNNDFSFTLECTQIY